ncbi:MAG: isoquinoline 1-oxidoreductase beta subunit [Spirosomataceae bacterium]|jgi:isoquinoline 1-oxidoreductase beta subunit
MKNIQNRRGFLKSAATAGSGLVLGFGWFTNQAFGATVVDAETINKSLDFNAFLSINPSGEIVIFSPNPEIGQGIKTAFPLIVAEELDVAWQQVTVKQAALDTNRFQRQLTGGSGAIKHSWERLREAGATARHMLMEAAANKWNIGITDVTTLEGYCLHPDGPRLSYADLANDAALLTPPKKVQLKNPEDFKLIGATIKGVDNEGVIMGKPMYGIDFKKEGMLHAQAVRPPAFGLKLKSFDATAAKAMSGITDVVSFDNKVAVVGKSTWEVMKARKALKIEWEKDRDLESSEDHASIFAKMLKDSEMTTRRKDGDVTKAFAEAAKIIEADYSCPFLPHNAMEPMNFFAHVKDNSVELVGPTQTPQRGQQQVAQMLNIPVENVSVELTKMGGGFGRRLNNDYALEAAMISSLTKQPIKLLWTREDDMTGGIYRPAAAYKFRAALDAQGNMTGFHLRGVGMFGGNPIREDNFPVGAVENVLMEVASHDSPITNGPWRAPITNFLAYAEQAFLDEVAAAAKKDPVQFRLELLEKAKSNPVGKLTYEPDRFIETIKMVADKAKWGKKKGVSQGLSVYFSHNSYVAQVAEMKKVQGKPTLSKVYAVTDCGIVINQSGAQNQIYGAIIDGIGHAMYGNLTFKDGKPNESNFDKYRLIRYNEVPEIEAYFVDNGISPTGLGEPALPPTGGAIANAIFTATGKRLYNQPFVLEDKKMETIL